VLNDEVSFVYCDFRLFCYLRQVPPF
jgi:hypothetical protein